MLVVAQVAVVTRIHRAGLNGPARMILGERRMREGEKTDLAREELLHVRDHAGIVAPGDSSLDIVDRAKHLHDVRGTFVTMLCRCG